MAAVVTGGGTGIGAALALNLAKHGLNVFIVGRRPDPLSNVASKNPNIIPIVADISSEDGVKTVCSKINESGSKVRFLVHNAGVLGPIKPALQYTRDEWKQVMDTNMNAPLFLTQGLLGSMEKNARILHVSSGAAHSAITGWTAYCVSKAALHMLYMCLNDELKSKEIYVGSFKPGIVNTEMQAHIRQGDAESFPNKDYFVSLHSNMKANPSKACSPPADCLDAPENVATFATWLLMETSKEDFSAEEWDIRNKAHHGKWTNREF